MRIIDVTKPLDQYNDIRIKFDNTEDFLKINNTWLCYYRSETGEYINICKLQNIDNLILAVKEAKKLIQ